MCWFHFKKACKNNVSKLNNKKHWAEIDRDLRSMHRVPHPFHGAFDYYLKLFMKKWEARGEVEYIAYFRKEWGGVLRRWARCHHSPGFATCNNGCERYNRWIKEVAKHKRNFVSGFIKFMVNQVKSWSNISKEKCFITPSTRPLLSQMDWIVYKEYLRDRKKEHGTLEKTVEGVSKFTHNLNELTSVCNNLSFSCYPFDCHLCALVVYFPSSISITRWRNAALSENDGLDSDETVAKNIALCRDNSLEKFIEFWGAMENGKEQAFVSAGLTTFERFKKRLDSFHVIKRLPTEQCRQDMFHLCSCPQHQDTARCKHAIHVGRLTGDIKNCVNSESIERKPKVGRPKKTADSLSLQPHEYVEDSSGDEGK